MINTLLEQKSFFNDKRFRTAVKLFNSQQWYKSHDLFEEIWHETSGEERKVIQGILQTAVGYYHLSNGNINGATVLLGEAIGRLKSTSLLHIYIEIDFNILLEVIESQLYSLQKHNKLANAQYPLLIRTNN